MSDIEDGRTIRDFTDTDARDLVEAGAEAADGVHTYVATGQRQIVDHPSGRGFFTLDRARDVVPSLLVVTEYSIDSEDLDKSQALDGALEDWATTPYPSRMREPNFGVVGGMLHISKRGDSIIVAPGSSASLVAIRGRTPVSMVFEAI